MTLLRLFRDIAKANWNELDLANGYQGHPALSELCSTIRTCAILYQNTRLAAIGLVD